MCDFFWSVLLTLSIPQDLTVVKAEPLCPSGCVTHLRDHCVLPGEYRGCGWSWEAGMVHRCLRRAGSLRFFFVCKVRGGTGNHCSSWATWWNGEWSGTALDCHLLGHWAWLSEALGFNAGEVVRGFHLLMCVTHSVEVISLVPCHDLGIDMTPILKIRKQF